MAGASGDQKDKTTSFPWEQQLCRRFSLADIQSATQDFDDALIIGQGGFGKVYKGPIENGVGGITVAAIKRLDCGSNQGASEFWAEIEMLSKLRHSHLVSLIGYCNDNDEMILVYEYMPRGTLYDHLYKLGTSLAWVQRLEICIGVARGLDYLHTGAGTQHGVIHRDIKSSNILLDENWAAKISDFGLSKICPTNQASTYVNTAIKGTFGYVDPDYFTTGKLSRRTDVYAFGVILFEVLSGRRAVDSSLDEEQWSLARWAQYCIRKGRLDQLVDPNLSRQIFPKCLKKFAQIAGSCLDNCPKQRPTMAEAVVSLEFVLALQGTNGNSIQLQPTSITTLSKKLLGFLLPSTELNSVDADASPSRNNEKDNVVTNSNGLANKDPVVNKYGEIATEVPQSGRIVSPNLKEFRFAALKEMTRNFSLKMLLGEGAFGQVFKGWVDKDTYTPSKVGAGMPVAIKRLGAHSMQGHAEWEAQVNFLGKFDHPNVIYLLGYCLKDGERILVFEFMKKGSLLEHLKDPSKTLSWAARLKIMIGAAQGLAFLHRVGNVIYRDVASSNILLDGDCNAKLAGFGFARSGLEDSATHVSTRVVGTVGVAAPEYVVTGHLSVKTDVYGFGVVLLEVLTCKRVLDVNRPSMERNLVDWARPYLTDKRRLKTIMDPHLKNEYPLKGATEAAKLVHICTGPSPKERPSMEQVLQTLEYINAIKDSRGN